MFYICQQQPSGEVEVIYSTPNEEAAVNECERTNSHFADAGIPGEYYYFVL